MNYSFPIIHMMELIDGFFTGECFIIDANKIQPNQCDGNPEFFIIVYSITIMLKTAYPLMIK